MGLAAQNIPTPIILAVVAALCLALLALGIGLALL
jgi:hypothetical protein